MIDPAQIKKKAASRYAQFLRSIITGELFFPIEFPIGAIPKDYPTLSTSVNQLIERSKQSLSYGYSLTLESRNMRKHGWQSLPTRIAIETESDYLRLIQKTTEVVKFRADLRLIRSQVPALEPWLYQKPLKLIKHSDSWNELLQVCLYFQQIPQPHLYIRELPIRVHTKFIEQNKGILRELLEAILPAAQLVSVEGEKDDIFEKRFSLRYREPLIRLRLLDHSLATRYGFPATDMSVPLSEFKQLDLAPHRCLITENLMNFLTLPPVENSFAIFGSGYQVRALKTIQWLSACPIFYWGDLDVDGFRILSQLRADFPQVISIMMDWKTFETFRDFAVPVSGAIASPLPQLTPDENGLYEHFAWCQQRLEQEHIHQAYANAILSKL
ncbi:MAG: Wadjet anti-phage system protein JetD domain-containing protein [Cyanobacteria bacterium P01_D01_bin.115]